MFFYITSQLPQGYKVGIASDIDQRQQQYSTLVPNIKFNLSVQTGSAEEIERSFKQRFYNHRVVNKNSSKDMKSEIYQVKLKYLIMHFKNCMHMKQRAIILTDNNLAFSKNVYLENNINLHLSNYYLPHQNKEEKFKNFNHSKIFPKLKIGEINSIDAGISERKTQLYDGRLTYYDFDLTNWKEISNLYLDNDLIYQADILKKFKVKKVNKDFKEFIIAKNLIISPYDQALSFLSDIWFKKLSKFKLIRSYSVKKLEESSGWSSQRLRFMTYPYPLKNSKLILNQG